MKYLKKFTCLLLAVLFCFIAVREGINIFSAAEEKIVYGDMDGDNKVDIQDATLVLRAALLIDELDESSFLAADVDGDLEVGLNDAQLVLKYALNIIDVFPVQEADISTNGPEQTDKTEQTSSPAITEPSEQTSSPAITEPSKQTSLPAITEPSKQTSSPAITYPSEKTNSPAEQPNILIAYFSKTGTTQSMAEFIQQETGGTLFKIKPVEDYPQSYQETVNIVNVERETDSRPQILNKVENIEAYDVVFVGFPIWFGDEPRIIRTFLESYDFKGKIVIPFCTSGGSGIGTAQVNIENLLKGIEVLDGIRISNLSQSSKDSVNKWLSKCKDEINNINSSDNSNNDNGGENNNVQDRRTMKIKVGEKEFTAVFAENSSAEALKKLLADGELTINMRDYGNFEKVGSIGTSLPANDEHIVTEPGDIILYQGDSLVIYYDTNTWNFTRVGKIENVTREELLSVLGQGSVNVTFSLQ